MPSINFCEGCQQPIFERYLCSVMDKHWHEKCMTCFTCGNLLEDRCFSREGKLFCKDDFYRRYYSTHCFGCEKVINLNEFVRKIRDKTFHLNCCKCSMCHKKIETGATIRVLSDDALFKLFCQSCYDPHFPTFNPLALPLSPDNISGDEDLDDPDGGALNSGFDDLKVEILTPNGMNGGSGSDLGSAGSGKGPPFDRPNLGQTTPDSNSTHSDSEMMDQSQLTGAGSGGTGAKRRGPRTTIKAKQLETLKNAFATTPKPTRHIREQLAQETGLNMRVIQVWFQNRRSKERRLKQIRYGGGFRAPGRRRGGAVHREDPGGHHYPTPIFNPDGMPRPEFYSHGPPPGMGFFCDMYGGPHGGQDPQVGNPGGPDMIGAPPNYMMRHANEERTESHPVFIPPPGSPELQPLTEDSFCPQVPFGGDQISKMKGGGGEHLQPAGW